MKTIFILTNSHNLFDCCLDCANIEIQSKNTNLFLQNVLKLNLFVKIRIILLLFLGICGIIMLNDMDLDSSESDELYEKFRQKQP